MAYMAGPRLAHCIIMTRYDGKFQDSGKALTSKGISTQTPVIEIHVAIPNSITDMKTGAEISLSWSHTLVCLLFEGSVMADCCRLRRLRIYTDMTTVYTHNAHIVTVTGSTATVRILYRTVRQKSRKCPASF